MTAEKDRVEIELPPELQSWVDSATEAAMVNNYRVMRGVLGRDRALLHVTDRSAFLALAEHAYAEGYAAGSGLERVPRDGEPAK